MSVAEKRALLEALLAAGLPPNRLMPGTGHSAPSDSIEMTRAAVELNCAGVLMLPPFYYKGVSDEGLFRVFAEVIERVGTARLRLYLYHIPPVSQVPITIDLIERLMARYPGVMAGVKDSSGDWTHTRALLDRFAANGLDVFAGSEVFLLETMRHGGKGCITAMANINPEPIADVYRRWRSADADRLQAGISATRAIVQTRPVIPALKAVMAQFSGEPAWCTCRPPLVELSATERDALVAELDAAGFSMPDVSA
jgi:4-hydroxy-tetrahydrodipicolinate synthase